MNNLTDFDILLITCLLLPKNIQELLLIEYLKSRGVYDKENS